MSWSSQVTSGERARLMVRVRKGAIVGGLLLLAALLVYAVVAKPNVAALAGFGYPGVTILMFLSSGSIFFPPLASRRSSPPAASGIHYW